LNREIGARGFNEADAGQMVLGSDVGKAPILELTDFADRAAFDGSFVGYD
jgi:hypothetical protein